jgi:hypothetical protein
MRPPATPARYATPASRTVLTAVVVAIIGWAGVVAIGAQLGSGSGAQLGFDFRLLIDAGREVAAGRSPYSPELIAGHAPTATELFYSYPPPIAQALAPLSWLPDLVALVLWDALAVAGLVLVAELLRRRLSPDRSAVGVAAITLAVAPLTLPYAVGLLFGNFDVFFPLLYGAMLLAVVDPTPRRQVLAGVGVVVASLKLHPASMGLWFLIRGLRDRASGSWRVVVSAMVAGLAVLAASVLLSGIGIWQDYLAVVRGGTGAVIVDPRNAGPAAIIAGTVGGGDALARTLHLAVGAAAVVVTMWAAWRRGDPVEGFAWATAASLCTLPVTWYHYPSAMLPVAIAAWLHADAATAPAVRILLISALAVGAVAIAALPLLWAAIALVILAARRSRPVVDPASAGSASVRPVPAGG